MSVNIFGSRNKNKPSICSSINSKFITLSKHLHGKVSKIGDSMSGELNMGNNKITDLSDPVSDKDAANKKYVDELITQTIDNVVKHANSVIEKTIGNLDIASKSYVDDLIVEKFEE